MKGLLSLLSLSFFLLLLPAGCKKEPKPIPGVTPFPQELKDLFYFQPGTWWIYEDSISGILDTITVESLVIDTLTAYASEGHIDGIYEVFTLRTYSRFYKYFYDYEFKGSVHRQFHLANVEIHKTRPGHYEGGSDFIFFPFTIGKKIGDSGGIITLTATPPELTVLGKTYTSCVSLYNDRCEAEPHYPELYYSLAKDVGVISKRIVNPEHGKDKDRFWQLKEYQIIK